MPNIAISMVQFKMLKNNDNLFCLYPIQNIDVTNFLKVLFFILLLKKNVSCYNVFLITFTYWYCCLYLTWKEQETKIRKQETNFQLWLF